MVKARIRHKIRDFMWFLLSKQSFNFVFASDEPLTFGSRRQFSAADALLSLLKASPWWGSCQRS
jgi:hypothetical protein